MARQHPHPLFGLTFLIAVAMLVSNDLFFKYEFHNTLTGKLSDIAGLFAFPYFMAVFFPKQAKFIYFATAIMFTIWKSELIQPLLDAAHSMSIGMNRTVDYTDLLTLAVLPFSYKYFYDQGKYVLDVNRPFKPIVIAICCFAFVATSLPREMGEINQKANLKLQLTSSREEVVQELALEENGDNYNCIINVPDTKAEVTCTVLLEEGKDGTITIQLDSIKEYEVRGGLFGGIDQDNVDVVKALTVKEYEQLFLTQNINRLYTE